MRIATLIIGLVLMLVAGIQSLSVAVLGNVADSLAKEDSGYQAGGGLGLIACLLWLIAAAFVIGKPRVATWLFGSATAVWLVTGLATPFQDAIVWAFACAILMAMARAGERELRKQQITAA